MLGQILALMVKEFLAVAKGRRARMALIVPPLVQLLIFGYAATFEVDDVPIAILNEDHGPEGRELAARFAGSPMFSVAALPTRDTEIPPMIDRAEIMAAVHIGQRFSADLRSGNAPDVQIITDGRRLNTALTVQNYATSVVARFNRDYAAANGFARPAAVTVTRAWFNPNLLSHWFVIPALAAKLTLIAVLTMAALSIARERELGSLEQLLVSSLTPLQIVAGKAMALLAIGLLQGLVITALGAVWFDVPFRGSAWLLALSLAAALVSIIGVGFAISSLASTQRQATLGAFLFMVPAVMFSGFATPISSMPGWMQAMTLVNPFRYFVTVMRSLFLRGLGWDLIWPQLWPMVLIGMVCLGASYWLLRRERR